MLTGLSIGLAIVFHRIFLLLALVFAVFWPLKRLFELIADSIAQHRHVNP